MKRIFISILMLVPHICWAENYIYIHDESGLSVKSTPKIDEIVSKANHISFKLDPDRYMVTAMLMPASEGQPFPLSEKINDIFYGVNVKRYPDMQVIERNQILIKFGDRSVLGSLFRLEYTAEKIQLCDLNFVHAVENRYYFNFTVTIPQFACSTHYDELMSEIRELYKHIYIDSI